MILQTKCNSCGKMIRFYSFASDRFELSKFKKDKNFELKCRKCGVIAKYDINEIEAKFRLGKLISISLMMVYCILLIILAPKYWDKIWEFSAMGIVTLATLLLVPFVVFIMINHNIESSQRRFNSNKI